MSSMTTMPAITGTVISGTLRPEDLVPAFVEALRVLDPTGARSRLVADLAEGADLSDQDEVEHTLEQLFDALDDALPIGWYFGAAEGDGACFGVWQWLDSE